MAAVLVGGSQRVVREAVRRSAVRPPAPGFWGCAPAGTAACEAGGGGFWAGALGCPPAGEPSGELQFPAAAAGLMPDGSCGSECAEGAWDRARVCCGGQAGLARESCPGEGLGAALRRLSHACRRLDMSH